MITASPKHIALAALVETEFADILTAHLLCHPGASPQADSDTDTDMSDVDIGIAIDSSSPSSSPSSSVSSSCSTAARRLDACFTPLPDGDQAAFHWALWEAFHRAARRAPHDSAASQRLAGLVIQLAGLNTSATMPQMLDLDLGLSWGPRQCRLWGGLPLFGATLAEAFEDLNRPSSKHKHAPPSTELRNLHAYAARVLGGCSSISTTNSTSSTSTSTSTDSAVPDEQLAALQSQLSRHAVAALNAALDGRLLRHRPGERDYAIRPSVALAARVDIAAAWIALAGPRLVALLPAGGATTTTATTACDFKPVRWTSSSSSSGDDETTGTWPAEVGIALPDHHHHRRHVGAVARGQLTVERWGFWRRRFADVARADWGVDDAVMEVARRAGDEMARLLVTGTNN